MRKIQDSSRSNSSGPIQWQNGSISDGYRSNLIQKANKISLKILLDQYHIYIDDFNYKIICPFPFHQEKTPSFNFYEDNNSFFCFGCQSGGGPVEFLSFYYDINKQDAAQRLISDYGYLINENVEEHKTNWKEKQNYLFTYSNKIKSFLQNNTDNMDDVFNFSETICKEFDKIYYKYPNMDIKAYKILLEELDKKLFKYKIKV